MLSLKINHKDHNLSNMESKSLFEYLPDNLQEDIYHIAHALMFKECLEVIKNMITNKVVLRMFNHYEVRETF